MLCGYRLKPYSRVMYGHIHTLANILNLVVCILLRVIDEVQGFPSNATLFQ
jgi:hypothetical protein